MRQQQICKVVRYISDEEKCWPWVVTHNIWGRYIRGWAVLQPATKKSGDLWHSIWPSMSKAYGRTANRLVLSNRRVALIPSTYMIVQTVLFNNSWGKRLLSTNLSKWY